MKRAIPLCCVGVALLAGAAGAVVPVPEGARAAGAVAGGRAVVEARLLVHPDVADAQDGRGSRRIGVLLSIEPGWHVYGPDPGDAGLPTQVAWALEDGRVGPTSFPPPRTFREADDLTTYGYVGEVLLTASARPGPRGGGTLAATVSLLACREECVPAELALERPLETDVAQAEPTRAVFARHAPGADAENGPPAPTRADPPAIATADPPAIATADPAAAPHEPRGTLLHALALAFVGGLILNLMPCVLPVLAIKACAVVELARRRRRDALAHGAAYTAGTVASMLALAAVVIALRAAGTAVGWGFQFQSPLFAACVSLVVVLFALNLFGVFEIPAGPGALASVGASASGARRSFFEGLLAVALATPCSAPFLGTATGFAFASPPAAIAAIFAAIGLGLAAPFTAVSLAPGLGRWLPRSGAWMLGLRTGLGFALLATAAWLLWVVGRSGGVDAMAAWLGLLVAFSFAAWVFGAAQSRGRPGLARGALAGAAAIALLGVGLLGDRAEPAGSGGGGAAGSAAPYDPAAIAAELSDGRPVFAYFTADWCITCKWNERTVLASDLARDELGRLGVAVFRADFTRRDDAIATELARYGRAGVPLYLVFDPRRPEAPRVLPELLTVDALVDALRDAGTLPDGSLVVARTRM